MPARKNTSRSHQHPRCLNQATSTSKASIWFSPHNFISSAVAAAAPDVVTALTSDDVRQETIHRSHLQSKTTPMSEIKTRDTVILGSGCSGLTAAIYAARANLKPLVLEGHEPGGQLSITTLVENFP